MLHTNVQHFLPQLNTVQHLLVLTRLNFSTHPHSPFPLRHFHLPHHICRAHYLFGAQFLLIIVTQFSIGKYLEMNVVQISLEHSPRSPSHVGILLLLYLFLLLLFLFLLHFIFQHFYTVFHSSSASPHSILSISRCALPISRIVPSSGINSSHFYYS